jgi:hypothetical protein
MDGLGSRHLIDSPLDHLDVPSVPSFDYFIFGPEEGFGAVMPKPLAPEFMAVIDRTSRGIRVGPFDRFVEPNTNPEARTCHRNKDSLIRIFLAFSQPYQAVP